MVSLKRPIIFSLLLLIVISAQNTIALTYLPESTYYSGKQYVSVPGGVFGDCVTIESAVYDNGGAEFTAEGFDLPLSRATDPCNPENLSPLVNGEHSYFLFIKNTHNYQASKYNYQRSLGDEITAPNPEPCTLALLGLGSVVLLKRQRKK